MKLYSLVASFFMLGEFSMGKHKLSIYKEVDKRYQELSEEYLKVAKIRNLSPVTI